MSEDDRKRQARRAEPEEAAGRGASGSASEPAPPDLEWHIEIRHVTGGVILDHQLFYRPGKFADRFIQGSTTLMPEHRWERRGSSMLETLEELPDGRSRGERVLKGDVAAELQGLGRRLWRLVPEAVQASYLEHWQEVESLCLYTEDTWFPWEVLLPTAPLEEEPRHPQPSFLCMNHRLARWFKQRMGPTPQLAIRRLLALAPSEVDGYPTLKGSNDVREWIERWTGQLPGLQAVRPTPAALEQAREALAGAFDAVHFDGHGRYDREQDGRSGLVFYGGILWADLLPEEVRRALRRSRPLVFLNACHAGRADFALTGVGGWPGALLPNGLVGALLCPQWQVRHSTADRFGARVYERLRRGEVLGEAVRGARRDLLDPNAEEPLSADDLTPLAYVLYGDPNAVVTFGGVSVARREVAETVRQRAREAVEGRRGMDFGAGLLDPAEAEELFRPRVEPQPAEPAVPFGERPLVFFAYAHEDNETADEIAAQLERRGVRVWQDKKSLRIGQRFEDEIDAAIERADFALILISPNSCQRVGFVNKEIRKIVELQDYRPEGIPFALPIKLEECTVPRTLRQLHWLTVTGSLSGFAERLAAEIHAHFESIQRLEGARS